jgi:hypothetical protein
LALAGALNVLLGAFSRFPAPVVKDMRHWLAGGMLTVLFSRQASTRSCQSIHVTKRQSGTLVRVAHVRKLERLTSACEVPGRFAFGLACLYICQKTPHGSSLVAFFGVCSTVAGILMAMLVGPGDGNAVDLEEGEKKWRAEQRAKAKAKTQTTQ